MDGVVMGTVKKNWDKDYPGQLLVEYSLAEPGKGETKWIPMMTPYSGAGFGVYFLPEIDSRVLLAFLYGDKDCPVVLGCQMGFDNQLQDATADEDNDKKRLSTKAGYQLLLDEKKDENRFLFSDKGAENSVEIASKDGVMTVNLKSRFVLQIQGKDFLTIEKGAITVSGDVTVKVKKEDSDEGSGLTVNAGTMTMKIKDEGKLEAKGLGLKAEKKIEIEGDTISLKSEKKIAADSKTVEISSDQTFSASAKQIKIDGSASLELKGKQTKLEGSALEMKAQASGKLESGGILQMKGTMLKLN